MTDIAAYNIRLAAILALRNNNEHLSTIQHLPGATRRLLIIVPNWKLAIQLSFFAWLDVFQIPAQQQAVAVSGYFTATPQVWNR